MTKLTYRRYLRLPELLDVQTPLSGVHDELLFVTIHQASELWMKLCLHELAEARRRIAGDDLQPALKMMARVSRIQAQLIQSWEVLATMTPADYAAMRDSLGTSSGFQSDQYRELEFMLGNRNAALIELFDESEVRERLTDELDRASLYEESLRLLGRRGLPVPDDRAPAGVQECWAAIYRDPDRYWDLYELAEKLVDLEYHLQLWRFSHLKTVERVIGFKTGTGGSAGIPYLARVIEQRFFPELLDVRTTL